MDRYPDYASFCADLRQQEKGRRYRELAGLHAAIPGEDDLSHFRRRVDAAAIEAALAVFVGLFRAFGLITANCSPPMASWSPPTPGSRAVPTSVRTASSSRWMRPAGKSSADQLQAGAKRLEIRCPFPEVVQKVLQTTTKKGKPREPTWRSWRSSICPPTAPRRPSTQQLSELLSLPPDQLPPLRIKWSHLTQGPQGELWGSCPKVPSDLEAKVGYHIDNRAPHRPNASLATCSKRPPISTSSWGWSCPWAPPRIRPMSMRGATSRRIVPSVALPFRPQQVELGDAGYDAIENYQGIRSRGGIPIIAYNPRHEDLSPEALLARGYDTHGTPYAPCGRLCRSNGYDYQSDSRQYVCGLPCPLPEREQCPHGQKVRGYTHRMSFHEYPRLIGPIQRGTEAWKILYAARTASERTNSYDQEVIDNGRPPSCGG